MESIPLSHPLRRLFSGLVENAFCGEVGVCNPRLTDYIVDLLVNFTHMDRSSMLRHAANKPLEKIAAVVEPLEPEPFLSPLDRDRRVHRNIGDFALFWAGVYPEQLKLASRDPSDVLLSYVAQGKRSYAIVSNLVDENWAPPSSLFRHLSEDFEFCIHGLGLVRREWERARPPAVDGGDIVR